MCNNIELVGVLTNTPPENTILKNPKRNLFLHVKRLSGKEDVIPLESKWNLSKYIGKKVLIRGILESRDCGDAETEHRLDIFVFVKECVLANTDEEDRNVLCITGTVSGLPVFRTTPLGKKISDIRIKTTDDRGYYSWIPCIIWGDGAAKAASLKPDAKVSVSGRFESREYQKRGEDKPRVAYEVSSKKAVRI